ncbi:MAG: hypothetical protein IPK70_14805 [Flavobacteriales bacterium]|jgi:hypothetical protein|nr:hypothetical protein [Flavobacteriales bacterium]
MKPPKRWMRRALRVLIGVGLFWGLLTWWAERPGRPFSEYMLADEADARTALIVFDPDPIYDLDAQVAAAMAKRLHSMGWNARVQDAASMDTESPLDAELRIVIANTYNWAPDGGVLDYVQREPGMAKAPVIAITLGSGSTARAHRIFLQAIKARGADVVGARELWLMRPNDESRTQEPNTAVACDLASELVARCAAALP